MCAGQRTKHFAYFPSLNPHVFHQGLFNPCHTGMRLQGPGPVFQFIGLPQTDVAQGSGQGDVRWLVNGGWL